jgi:hypothetical protein
VLWNAFSRHLCDDLLISWGCAVVTFTRALGFDVGGFAGKISNFKNDNEATKQIQVRLARGISMQHALDFFLRRTALLRPS